MSEIIDKLALSFSSTERRKGAAAAEDRAVHLSSTSDTLVTAFVGNSTPARVTLSTSEVADGLITAKCTCTVAKKGQLCRHIWATLLKLDDQNHDFLLSKESISLAYKDEDATTDTDDAMVYRYGDEPRGDSNQNLSAAQLEFQEKQKALSKEYRKQRARAQKEMKKQLRNKDAKTAAASSAFHYPPNIEQARRYFQANGFEMKQPFELSEIVDAKKQLSRVFHPDKGGSHNEILELNRNFQILNDYLKS
jgi:hypothetical protein